MWKRGVSWVVKQEWLIVVLVVVVILRIPSLFEPYWYGDEGIYLTLGQAMRSGVELYKQIHDNKPPLLYVMAAAAGGNLFWFKLITLLWNLVTIAVFSKLAKKVFEPGRRKMKLAVWVFAMATTLPVLEGNIANAELFFLLPTVWAMYWLWDKNVQMKYIIGSGLVLGVAALFKMPAVLEAGVWPLVWLVEGDKSWWKKTIILAIGITAVIGVSGVYFAWKGAGREYLVAAWAQNLPYLSTWKAVGGSGIYAIKGRMVITALVLTPILGLARKWGRRATILGTWGVITLFAALLSGRPYPHYLLQSAGVIAIAAAVIIRGSREERVIAWGLSGLTIAAFIGFKFYLYPVAGYYANFARWVIGTKTRSEYFGWFNPQVNKNYQIAGVVMAGSGEGDKVFVWGDEPMIYALVKRLPASKYTVEYHIKDFRAQEETIAALKQNPPKYIVSLANEAELPGLAELLDGMYRLEKTVDGVRIYRLSRLSLYN